MIDAQLKPYFWDIHGILNDTSQLNGVIIKWILDRTSLFIVDFHGDKWGSYLWDLMFFFECDVNANLATI